jgi:hypothetical protein
MHLEDLRGVAMRLIIRTAGLALATAALIQGAALAGDGLAPRPPERLVIESQQRVSDGRKLQREADDSLRKAAADDSQVGVDRGKREAAARDSSLPRPAGDGARN